MSDRKHSGGVTTGNSPLIEQPTQGFHRPLLDEESAPIGIVKALAELPEGALLTEEQLARIFNRHPVSVKRAVERRELPPPVRLFGKPTWTAGAILAHLDTRLEAAKREAEREAARLARHSP